MLGSILVNFSYGRVSDFQHWELVDKVPICRMKVSDRDLMSLGHVRVPKGTYQNIL